MPGSRASSMTESISNNSKTLTSHASEMRVASHSWETGSSQSFDNDDNGNEEFNYEEGWVETILTII